MAQQRFTVFTQDADEIVSIGPTATARRRQFTWKLKGNRSYHDVKKLKMSIESIHCRNMNIIIQGDQNKQFQTRAVNTAIDGADDGVNSIVGKTSAMGNTDEKELYTIRCNGVSSVNHFDTRPPEYKTGAIIYTGALNFKNTNPKECFCYEVNKDILTSEFSLYIDTNFKHPTTNVNTFGLADHLQLAITFILYDE